MSNREHGEKTFDGTTAFLDTLPPERALSMVTRTRMGGALVAIGTVLVVASFSLAGLILVKNTELGVFAITFLVLLLLVGMAMLVIGATFWSTQIVSHAVGDVGRLAKSGGGIAKLFRKGK